MNATLSIDDDTLSAVLEHIEDVDLVDSMRTCAQFARCVARVLRKRHNLESHQLVAYVAALLGKNVFITGGGGCGKSFVSQLIVAAARERMSEAAVVVCAPTGLAAAAVGGITLDRVMGTRKVRATWPTCVMTFDQFRQQSNAPNEEEEEEEDNAFLASDEVFAPVDSHFAKVRLSAVRTILIDEVSMVSAAKLELLFTVLAHYGVEWTRVQFVFVGDFAQLKPVCPKASPEARAPRGGGCFAFSSPIWAALRLVPAPLSVNRRCSHPEWNKCLARLRNGEMSASLRGRIRALTAEPALASAAAAAGWVGIFGRKEAVREFNRVALETRPGVLRTVFAEDTPTEWGAVPKRLPAALSLKAGCSVLVTRNLPNQLYNGALGVVTADIDADNGLQDGVWVAFDPDALSPQRIGAFVDQKTYKRGNMVEEGQRRQIPLQFAAAFTVHKAQGRSISRPLHVDASSFWKESGMFYVALSRTTDPSILAIEGLNNAKAYIAPEVQTFHRSLEARPVPKWARD
jgi:ATP-dependent exoDNAse (exonuclease V) alpha subunit